MAGKTPRQLQIERLLRDDPDDPFLLYGHAMEHAGAGDDESAAAGLRDLIAKHPDYVAAYLQAGQVLVRLDRVAEACDVLRAGLAAARREGNDHAHSEMSGLLASIE